MVRIEQVETVHVALPTRRVHRWSGLTEAIGGYVLVPMTGDDGQTGWGETPVLKDWGGDWGRYVEVAEQSVHLGVIVLLAKPRSDGLSCNGSRLDPRAIRLARCRYLKSLSLHDAAHPTAPALREERLRLVDACRDPRNLVLQVFDREPNRRSCLNAASREPAFELHSPQSNFTCSRPPRKWGAWTRQRMQRSCGQSKRARVDAM